MSTNVWVFSLPRIVLSSNPLKAKKKVDGSTRGLPVMQEDGGKASKDPDLHREQNPLSHFTEGKTVTAGG